MRMRTGPRRSWHRATAVAALLVVLATPAVSQTDSVAVVAGAQYRPRNQLHTLLLGSRYRDLWTTPIRVEVLDLDRFAGGLTPVRKGGFKQTRALRLRGADGREYNFRSVDKELTAALPEYARETVVDWARQDVTSAQLPVAPIVATALLDAAGVLNPGPRLMVLPDDPSLGEFRAEFAGMLGTLEVHANEGENGEPLFANSPRVVATETLLERLEQSPEDRIDARAFLTARLMDALLGDFDRHGGQWRWAQRDSAGVRWWLPVPEDRDYAFVDYDGALLSAARLLGINRLPEFQEEYPGALTLMVNSLALNQRLLAELPREAWDSVATSLRARLTDAVIDDAVARMPRPYVERVGAELAATLKARRERLPRLAQRMYDELALAVEVHATDQADRAEIVQGEDGTLLVQLFSGDAADRQPYFQRRLFPDQTHEVRVFLHGGNDVAVVRGAQGRVKVRIVGGGGNDTLRDVSSGPTVLYDARGDNQLIAGPNTRVDRREYEPPEPDATLLPSFTRDFGGSGSWFKPVADWRPHAEVVIGGGPGWKQFGFRHHPYALRAGLSALYAPLANRGGVEGVVDYYPENTRRRLELFARASNLEATLFHGFGNDTERQPSQLARVWHQRTLLRPMLRMRFAAGAEMGIGGFVRYTDPQAEPGSPVARLDPRGAEPLGQVGAAAELELDTRDDATFPRRGLRARLSGQLSPGVWDLNGAYGRLEARASTYLPLPARSVLALRAGGSMVGGDFPFYDAAFIGGSGSLRGYSFQRFAGDRAVHGTGELRIPLAPLKLVLRGTLGVSTFADAARVYVDGDSPGGWHTGLGAGLWFATPPAAVNLSFARGERNRVYLKLKMPF